MDLSEHDAESFEAGALAALEHITDERPDLEAVTMRAAEKIGADVLKLADRQRGAVDDELRFDARVALPEAQERFQRAEAEVARLRAANDTLAEMLNHPRGAVGDE